MAIDTIGKFQELRRMFENIGNCWDKGFTSSSDVQLGPKTQLGPQEPLIGNFKDFFSLELVLSVINFINYHPIDNEISFKMVKLVRMPSLSKCSCA